jgi:hypothetical protein
MRTDDRRERQMKQSLEGVKRKINELLKVFKGELDRKFDKKIKEMSSEVNSTRHPFS